MSAVLLRFLVYAIIIGGIYFGVRKILSDWKRVFRQEDKERLERDRQERKRPGVIDLKRGDDGVFRPGGRKDDEP